MEFREKLEALAARGRSAPAISRGTVLGFIPRKRHHGWVSAEDRGDHWFVLWTNREDAHSRIGGQKCYAADFRKDNALPYTRSPDWTGAWESAIRLWPVYEDEREKAEWVFRFIRERVDFAVEELDRERSATVQGK